jgi:hypothetical protein
MTGVPFEVYPRRVVRTPSGQPALVLVRRNADPDPPPLLATWNWDPRVYRNLWCWVRRIVRRDHSWLVEIFPGIEEDLNRPNQAASDALPAPDRSKANELADRACRHLQQKGYSAGLLRQLASEAEGA